MLHPNEIKIDQTNMDTLTQEAQTFSPKHMAALEEQMERQSVKTK
jgi:hypothetical protein